MSTFSGASPGDPRNGIFAAAGVFLTSVWVTVSLRIWVRTAMVRAFGLDDATLLFASVIFTGYCVVVILVETTGGAPRVQKLNLAQLSQLLDLTIASFDLYIATMIFVKLSLGIFFLRFVIRPWQRYTVYTTMTLSTGYGIFLFFVALLNCGDPSKYLQNELNGMCMSNNSIYGIQLAGALVNAVTDWIFAILPVFILIKATMPVRAKVCAGLVLLLGCCGSVVSLVRIQYIKGLQPGPNFFNNAIDLCIWSIIECGLGISAAATATLRPLFRSLRERTNVFVSFGSRSKSAMDSNNQTRMTDTMFGDWGLEPPEHDHELRHVESQGHFSITPMLKHSRVLSKIGIARGSGIERTSSPMLPTPSRAAEVVRQKSQRMQDRVSRFYTQPETEDDRPGMVRQLSVREKGISRPIPHIISQEAPPTPTSGENPQDLIRIDHRRNGSPNWISSVNRTPASSSSNPFFEPRNSFFTYPASPGEGRPF